MLANGFLPAFSARMAAKCAVNLPVVLTGGKSAGVVFIGIQAGPR
jgi:hypothetical protein